MQRKLIQTTLILIAIFTLGLATCQAAGEVDTGPALQVDKWCKENPSKVRVANDDTYDQCRGGQLVTIDGRDGKISLTPGQTRYFALQEVDDYTRSGGFYWYCSGTREQSRLRGAKYIKVDRDSGGQMHFQRIELAPI